MQRPAPAPPMRHATVVATRQENPGECRHPAIVIHVQYRVRLRHNSRKRVAGAVGEAELRFANGRQQQYVSKLVPNPARIACDADGFSWRVGNTERFAWSAAFALPRL